MTDDKYILQPVDEIPGMVVIGERGGDGQYVVCDDELPAHLRGARGAGPYFDAGEQEKAQAALEWLRTPRGEREHLDKDAQIAALQAEIAQLRESKETQNGA